MEINDPLEEIYKKQDVNTLENYLKVLLRLQTSFVNAMDEGLKAVKKDEREKVVSLINQITHPETFIGEALDSLQTIIELLPDEINRVQQYLEQRNKLKSGKYVLKVGDIGEDDEDNGEEGYELEEGDYVLRATGNIGQDLEAFQHGGGYDYYDRYGKYTKGNQYKKAIRDIKEHMEEKKFYPNIWFEDDHGGLTLYKQKDIDEILN